MAKHPVISCPICEKRAKQTRAYDGYLDIHCSHCGHFQISETFRQLVSRHPLETRQRALEGAVTRARYGFLPLVTSYDLP